MATRTRKKKTGRRISNRHRSEWRLLFALSAALVLLGLLRGDTQVPNGPTSKVETKNCLDNALTNVATRRSFLPRGFGATQ